MSKSVKIKWNIDEILRATADEVDDAMFAGGEEVAGAISRKVPRRSGDMARSIYVATQSRSTYQPGPGREKQRQVGPAEVVVGVSDFAAHFVEGGVGPHTITSRTPGGMLKLFGGKIVKSVRHPGFAARPFVRPALDESRAKAGEVATATLRAALQKRGG